MAGVNWTDSTIEAGGTKFVLGVGHGPDAIIDQLQIPTRDPETTLAETLWLEMKKDLDAISASSQNLFRAQLLALDAELKLPF